MRTGISIRKLTLAGLFAAIVCVMTIVVKVPSPTGYTNLGDGAVLLGAFVLGPVWGFAAGGLGSMLADLLLGYAAYAPASLLIKGGVALLAALLMAAFRKGGHLHAPARIFSCALAEVFMVLGYLFYETVVLRYGIAAVQSVPANLVQGLFGVTLAEVAYHVLARTPVMRKGSGL